MAWEATRLFGEVIPAPPTWTAPREDPNTYANRGGILFASWDDLVAAMPSYPPGTRAFADHESPAVTYGHIFNVENHEVLGVLFSDAESGAVVPGAMAGYHDLLPADAVKIRLIPIS